MGEWLHFYWYVFVSEWLDHLPIVGALLFLLVILAGGLKGLGLPYLFWHRRPLDRGVAGLASGVLVTFSFYVSYLLDAVDTLSQMRRIGAFGGLRIWPGGWYFLGCLGCLVATAAIAFALPLIGRIVTAVPRAEHQHVERQSWVGSGGLPLFVATFLAGLSLSTLIWWSIEDGVLGGWLARADFLDWLMIRDPVVFVTGHRFAALAAMALSLSLIVGAWGGRRCMPASVSICVLLGWIVSVDGFLGFTLGEAPAVSLAVIACLMLLAGRARYKVRLNALAHHYKDPVPLARGWKASEPAGERPALPEWNPTGPTLVLVAASGGGVRAAVWTAAVLTELERVVVPWRPVMTPWNIGLVTGASGGMVGATFYTLTLRHTLEGPGWHVIDGNDLVDAVAEESLSDLAQRLVFHDMPLALVPKRHSRDDRGTRLDDALERHLRRKLAPGQTIPSSMADLQPFEARGLVPSLVYTPMLIEDGRRLFISNADLDRLSTSDGGLVAGGSLYSRNAFQFHQLFEGGLTRLSPWTAARLSASFPYVTPAPTLPTVPRRRVVDAGYWDNFGVNLCSSWLEDCLCQEERRRWLGQFRNVLLLQIRDGVLCYGAREAPDQEQTRTMARGMEWLTSPPEAVLAARNAVAIYRGDEQVESLSEVFGPAFSTAVVEFKQTASLSWALTEDEVRTIKKAAAAEVAELAPTMANFVTPATAPIARPRWFHHAS